MPRARVSLVSTLTPLRLSTSDAAVVLSPEAGMVVHADTAARFRKGIKQVATLGPKTFSKDMIEKLFLASADVFRLNPSHGAEDKVDHLYCIFHSTVVLRPVSPLLFLNIV